MVFCNRLELYDMITLSTVAFLASYSHLESLDLESSHIQVNFHPGGRRLLPGNLGLVSWERVLKDVHIRHRRNAIATRSDGRRLKTIVSTHSVQLNLSTCRLQ